MQSNRTRERRTFIHLSLIHMSHGAIDNLFLSCVCNFGFWSLYFPLFSDSSCSLPDELAVCLTMQFTLFTDGASAVYSIDTVLCIMSSSALTLLADILAILSGTSSEPAVCRMTQPQCVLQEILEVPVDQFGQIVHCYRTVWHCEHFNCALLYVVAATNF